MSVGGDLPAGVGDVLRHLTHVEDMVSPGAFAHHVGEGGEWNATRAARERFVHARDDLDRLVRMAATHYQFEAIHPFHDGDGCTGRVINILMLIHAGLLREPILHLSRAIIARTNDHHHLLRAVSAEGAWEPLRFLRGANEPETGPALIRRPAPAWRVVAAGL